MKRTLPLLLILLLLAVVRPLQAQAISPGETAETVRTHLFNAQLALTSGDNAQAAAELSQAQAAYETDFAATLAKLAPEQATHIASGWQAASEAIGKQQVAALAQARAEIWTAVLGGSYQIVIASIHSGDIAQAQSWLTVREFRPPTRFSRPSADATLALAHLKAGQITADEAVVAVQADLLDTYQARLTATLHDLVDLAEFPGRRAEYAALAQGYFAILTPSYAAQHTPEELAAIQAQWTSLQTAVAGGSDILPAQTALLTTLQTFRAAPLTATEQARRAGQLLRFLNLVLIEYQRGVHDGTVTRDLEIQEALTFYEGAFAAFGDLQSDLNRLNPQQTAQALVLWQTLLTQLQETQSRANVRDPQVVQGTVDELTALFGTLFPAEWQKASSDGDFEVIASLLDQMETAVANGDYEAAESARLEAYATLETGPEARLIAFAPQAIPALENYFWNGQDAHAGLAYLLKQRAPLGDIRATRADLDQALAAAQSELSVSSAPAVIATNAGIIVFREGLEAVLILASLMGSFKAEDSRRYRRPMWLGAFLAFVATVLTWVLAHELLTTLARYGERLEAVVSMIAIGVLLLITNWFFHKVYWTGWMANFHSQKRRLLSAENSLWVGLIILGFTSIYREGFESVLFLQALVLEGGTAVVLAGVALGLLATSAIGFVLFSLQTRLPYMKMLIFTGIMIGFVLLVMVGNTVHVWQIVGWLPIHPIRTLTLPYWAGSWFGTYPTWEGFGLQIAAGIFVIGSYYLAEYLQKRQRPQGQPQPKPELVTAVPSAPPQAVEHLP